MKLPKSAYLAIAAVAKADGRLTKGEAEGLLRAAKVSGLDDDEVKEIEEAANSDSLSLDEVDLGELNEFQEAVVYAVANFLARLDGIVNAQEMAQLRALGERLTLPKQKLDAAASAAFDIAVLPGGERPEKYDFDALTERLKVKLPSLAAGADS